MTTFRTEYTGGTNCFVIFDYFYYLDCTKCKFPDFSQYSFFPWHSTKFPDFSLTFAKSGISLTFPWPLDTLSKKLNAGISQSANTLGSILIRHRSIKEGLDQCLITINVMLIAIWDAAMFSSEHNQTLESNTVKFGVLWEWDLVQHLAGDCRKLQSNTCTEFKSVSTYHNAYIP